MVLYTGKKTVVVVATVLVLSLSSTHGQLDFDCVRNSPEILTQCGAELQYSGAVIPFNRSVPASEDEIQAVRDAFEENKLPTEWCCAVAKAFSEAKCLCKSDIRQLLPAVGFEVASINSVMSVVQESCGGFQYITEC